MKKLIIILIASLLSKYSFAQVSGSFNVGGALDKFYPVSFQDGGWISNAPTNLILGRSTTHTDGDWRGSLMATFNFHVSKWGNGSHFIDADIKPLLLSSGNSFIAGWQDVTTVGYGQEIIIWLRGGGTTYYYKSNYAVNPVVYDGVQNALPFQVSNNGQLSFKTTIEDYASTAGKYEGRNAYFASNVGIGTTTPSSKLEVKGTIKSYEPLALGNTANSFQLINEMSGNVGENTIVKRLWTFRDGTLNNWFNSRIHDGISIDDSFKTPNVDTRTWWERDPNDNIQSWGNANETYLTINKGNVGIGTTVPDEKLTVKGKIHTQEVRVDMLGPLVPDYVFAKEYQLKSLDEVETYIKQNSHLPEIPSAQEIEKNGLMLAEMNMALLKKIEELTLYVIDQKKHTDKLIQIVEEQNKRLKILEENKN